MASICNNDWASLGVISGHERKTLRRSALGRGIGHFTVIEPPAMTSPADDPRFPRPAQFAPAAWAARVQLAAAYRIFDRLGWAEQIYHHISLRVPGEPGTFCSTRSGCTTRRCAPPTW